MYILIVCDHAHRDTYCTHGFAVEAHAEIILRKALFMTRTSEADIQFHARDAHGYLSRALNAWERAWDQAKGETEPRARAVADFSIGEFLDLSSKVGHTDAIAARLEELGDRAISDGRRRKSAWRAKRWRSCGGIMSWPWPRDRWPCRRC